MWGDVGALRPLAAGWRGIPWNKRKAHRTVNGQWWLAKHPVNGVARVSSLFVMSSGRCAEEFQNPFKTKR